MELKTVFGDVIFALESENTIKYLVLAAIGAGKSLRDADLRGANLRGANLRGANLRGANLSDANLRDADLRGADLSDANLRDANLRGANLSDADLRGADLRDANLRDANLRGANLSDANLRDAYLRDADLSDAKNADLALAKIQFIPTSGSFEGWKICRNNVIVHLLIPADAKRSHGSERKCRASHVLVLDVIDADKGISSYTAPVIYRKGETVQADSFDDNRWNVCSHGIHFFLTRIEAENYKL